MKLMFPKTLLALCIACPCATAQGVLINEFVAKNTTGIEDEVGEREDWIELHNPTAAAITVGGLYLTDDITNPTKWQIPTGNVLQPNETMHIWCDEQRTQGPLHANFKLNNEGEELAIYDGTGLIQLDYISYGKLRRNNSLGRVFDGQPLWLSFPEPTPYSPNAPAGCGTRLYSAPSPKDNPLTLDPFGTPTIGTTMSLTLSAGPISAPSVSFLGTAPGNLALPISTSVMVLNPPLFTFISRVTSSIGVADFSFPIPNDTILVNVPIYVQCWAISATALMASNGVEITFCAP